MKIFGKRTSKKAPVAAADKASVPDDVGSGKNSTTATTKSDEDVPSYFSSAQTATGNTSSKQKKQPNKTSDAKNGDDMQALLAMDPSTLNAKQRRLVRRHKERDGSAAVAGESIDQPKQEETLGQNAKDNSKDISIPATNDNNDSTEQGATPTPAQPKHTDEQQASTSDTNIAEILGKLEGLNSKDRRKFLRSLRGGAVDEKVIVAAEEQARKVAERNEKEAATVSGKAVGTSSVTDKRPEKRSTEAPAKPKKKRRKKGPPVNLADLPPEERARREEQRRMQVEAVERREAGLVDPNRHPLNSERRRANRRKPSRFLIEKAKRAEAAKGNFNAVGYQMRRSGAGS